ncbi:unnamed protein product [Trichobilharzia regenti]|nr:unnamed protein product [Trichobilharzia regenti]
MIRRLPVRLLPDSSIYYNPVSLALLISFFQRICRQYSKGFLQSLIEKVKEETSKDAELKKKIEKEMPTDTVEKVRDTIKSVKSKIREDAQQLARSETLRKSMETLSKAGEHGVEVVEQELQSDRSKMYQAPKVLFFYKFYLFLNFSETSGVVVHKDSKWVSAWQDFKENNQYVQRFFDLKAHYEESDHLVIRSVRFVTDRISGLFSKFWIHFKKRLVTDYSNNYDLLSVEVSSKLSAVL